jgi:hypothetical protein
METHAIASHADATLAETTTGRTIEARNIAIKPFPGAALVPIDDGEIYSSGELKCRKKRISDISGPPCRVLTADS